MDHPGDLTNQAQKTRCDSWDDLPGGARACPWEVPCHLGHLPRMGKTFSSRPSISCHHSLRCNHTRGSVPSSWNYGNSSSLSALADAVAQQKLGGFLFRNQRNTGWHEEIDREISPYKDEIWLRGMDGWPISLWSGDSVPMTMTDSPSPFGIKRDGQSLAEPFMI